MRGGILIHKVVMAATLVITQPSVPSIAVDMAPKGGKLDTTVINSQVARGPLGALSG